MTSRPVTPLVKLGLLLYTRKCHGCDAVGYHTHHLTWLGRWHYTRPEKVWLSKPRRDA